MKKCLGLSGEVRLKQDIYDVLRRADLIWDKSGEKQPRRRKEARKLLAERGRRTNDSKLRDFFLILLQKVTLFIFSNDPIQFDVHGLAPVCPSRLWFRFLP